MSENPIQKFEGQLLEIKDRWISVLPENISEKRFVSTVMTAVAKNRDLLNADRASLLLACTQAAGHGLLPDGRQGAIVTFRDRRSGKYMAQWMPMVVGIVQRLRELGDLTSISAYCVYKGDTFEVTLGDDAKISHVVDPFGGRGPDDVVAAYAIFKNGSEVVHREVMTREEIDQIRGISRAGKAGPWVDWYGEMARKTVIRRGAKNVPLSSMAAAIIESDDQWTDFDLKADDSEKPPIDNPLVDTPDVADVADVANGIEDAEIIEPAFNEKQLIEKIEGAQNPEELEEFGTKYADSVKQLAAPAKGRIRSAYKSRLKSLRQTVPA